MCCIVNIISTIPQIIYCTLYTRIMKYICAVVYYWKLKTRNYKWWRLFFFCLFKKKRGYYARYKKSINSRDKLCAWPRIKVGVNVSKICVAFENDLYQLFQSLYSSSHYYPGAFLRNVVLDQWMTLSSKNRWTEIYLKTV